MLSNLAAVKSRRHRDTRARLVSDERRPSAAPCCPLVRPTVPVPSSSLTHLLAMPF